MLLLMAHVENSAEQGQGKTEIRPSAYWTMLGSTLFLAIYATINRGFSDIWPVLIDFLQGDLSGARQHGDNLVRLAPVVAATTVIMIAMAMMVGPILSRRIRRIDPNFKSKNTFDAQTPRRQFAAIMVTLVTEELYARWLFLGVLTQIPLLSGNLAFYALVLVGNGTWAWVHLLNYENKALRSWIMVSPQFIVGIMLTSVYLSFGLVGAILAHVAYDMVLFAVHRKDVFNAGEIALVVYHLIVGGISFAFFTQRGHDLRELKTWLHNDATSFVLPGWSFADYVLAVLCVTSLVTVLLEVLLFDREGGESPGEVLAHMVWFITGLLGAFTILAGVQEVWHEALLIKVLILSVCLTFMVKSASGSGIARAFWEALTITSVMVATIMAVGPMMALWLVLVIAVVHAPDRVIRYLDSDQMKVAVETTKSMAFSKA